MEKDKVFENYPLRIVLLSNFVAFMIYVLGFLIMSRAGILFSSFYLFYVLILELRLVRNHCTKCYYYGKTCGFGRGRISSIFFRKGDVSLFCAREIKWKDMIPDILVSLIPFITAVVLLVMKFNFFILSELVLLLLLTTAGNGYIRGQQTCKYCKQKGLGCPAYRLFDKAERGQH